MGLAVDVVEFFETPLFRAIGPQMGRVLEAIHRDHGVRFHLGEGVERFEGDGRVERVVTDHGTAIECDFARVDEPHHVNRRNVYALGQAARIRD